MTAASVVPGALVDVSAAGVVRGELVAGETGAVVTPGGVDTQLATPSATPSAPATLINILAHQTFRIHAHVARSTTENISFSFLTKNLE